MYVHFILIVTFSMERLRFRALRLGLGKRVRAGKKTTEGIAMTQ